MNRPLLRLGRTVGICCVLQLLLVVSLKRLIEPSSPIGTASGEHALRPAVLP